MKLNIFLIRILLAILFLFFSNASLFAELPMTIPALQEWSDQPGRFCFSSKTRIVINEAYYQDLLETAETFAEDLLSLKNFKSDIVKGIPESSDIYFTLGLSDSVMANEGYGLTIGDRIEIRANTETGIFYGTRTLLQLLKSKDTIAGGTARDYPAYPERGFMVDNGRKFFTVKWLENQIKEISYIKMNYFHWHFSDNQGFRIESISHPEIVSDEHYSIEEVKYLLNVGKKYHVVIVPEIDMPSHMQAILRNHIEDFALKDKWGNPYTSYLDITSETARQFAKEIIFEFMDLFPGTYWHGGCDEFIYDNFERFPQLLAYSKQNYGDNAIASDAIIDFINWLNKTVRGKGRTLRVWNDEISLFRNDGGVVFVDSNIVIEYWLGADEPTDFVKEGHKIYNCSIDFLYYNLGCSWLGYDQFLYEIWEPNIFQGAKIINENLVKILGAKYHIWCDNPDLETEGHVAIAIRPVMKMVSQGLWGSPKLVPVVSQFKEIIESVGMAPGVSYPENPTPGNIAFRKNVFAESFNPESENLPLRINDGNRNTRWESDNRDTSWIFVDLSDTFQINHLRIVWFNTIPTNFQLQLSNDSFNWQTIKNCNDSNSRIMDLNNLSSVGRFIRLNLLGKVDSPTYSLWEIEVYGDKYTIPYKKDEPKIEVFKLYPTPFHDVLTIEYYLGRDDYVRVKVLDISGKDCTDLFEGLQSQGRHIICWSGSGYPSGEYFIRVESGKNSFTQKTIMLK